MMAYKIMLVMLIFCSVNSGVNALGWYTQKLPEQKAIITEAEVTDLTNQASETAVNAWTMWTVIKMIFGVIGGVMLSLLTIIPFLTAYGVPIEIATMVQMPVWLVLAWGIYGMWTGHVSQSQD
jgi:sterol desaturase/sphingolipid hydroxylase (fatty acid hydroxylase superfamily)